MNFVKLALENGGDIKPLLIDYSDLNGPSITNPSVFVYKGKILVNLRNVNYTSNISVYEKYDRKDTQALCM